MAPVAVLNLGGVANVTWLDGSGDILAFDTGPANALLDDWMMLKRDLAYDENGQLGASGTPDEAVLRAYLSDRVFFSKPAQITRSVELSACARARCPAQ
jgi:anhydro-N-acetylmuramic acid kinase